MKEQKKKRIIVILLFISCLISGYMFFSTSDGRFKQLNNIALADSLIKNELSNFDISEKQVEVVDITVDSGFVRKIYRVDVPPAFSKTHLHAELNRTFYKYSVKTPATVTLPEKDVQIHFLYNGTVIRTLKLRTDTDLVFKQETTPVNEGT